MSILVYTDKGTDDTDNEYTSATITDEAGRFKPITERTSGSGVDEEALAALCYALLCDVPGFKPYLAEAFAAIGKYAQAYH